MKICGYCGSQLDDSAVACSYCGRVIVGDGDPEAAREHAREAEQAARKQEQAGAAYNQGPGWQQNNQNRQDAGPSAGPGWQQNNQNRQDAGPSAGPGWQQNRQGQSGSWEQNQQTQGGSWQQNQQTQGGAWQQNQQGSWQQNPQGSWQQNAPYQQPMYGPEETRRTNVCGLVSFIMGLVSIIGGAIYLLPPIAAIVLAIVALVQHSRRPQMYSQKGFAIAGLVLGIVFLIFWGAVFVYTFSMMNSFMNSGGSLEDIQGLLDYLQNNFGGFFFLK